MSAPPASSAPSSPSSSSPRRTAASGGGSTQRSRAGSSTPQARSCSTSDARSAVCSSGSSASGRWRCSASAHSRYATPGAVRPARPRRWSALARLAAWVDSTGSPVATSTRTCRRRPASTTTRTPGTVTELSATLVASTTRRARPTAAGASTRSWSSAGTDPCNSSTSTPAVARDRASSRAQRRSSPRPGRKTSTSPSSLPSASTTTAAVRDSIASWAEPGRYRVSTSNIGVVASITGASPRACATGPVCKRGRHDQDPQVRSQRPADVERQRQPEIRVDGPLVELVEHHAGHALEGRVGLEAPQQQPLGDDLDADVGLRRDARRAPRSRTARRPVRQRASPSGSLRHVPRSDAAR